VRTEEFLKSISESVEAILGKNIAVALQNRLIGDIGMESIDVIDFLHEIERRTGVEVRIPRLLEQMHKSGGRRFDQLTVQDLINYLENAKK